jgi:hypothetical protein
MIVIEGGLGSKNKFYYYTTKNGALAEHRL